MLDFEHSPNLLVPVFLFRLTQLLLLLHNELQVLEEEVQEFELAQHLLPLSDYHAMDL